MRNFSVVSKLRVAVSITPILLLLAAPFVAVGIYTLGQAIDVLHDHNLMAVEAARGMEISLYQMEWGLTRPGAQQILSDQRRQFVHWVGLAQDRADTDDQRRLIVTLAQRADPILDQLRQIGSSGGRIDDELERRMRELHGLVNDLIAADDATIMAASSRTQAEARRLTALLLVITVVFPWLGFAIVMVLTSRLQRSLHSIRQSLERLGQRAQAASHDADLKQIDDSLTELGFPAPNPMLAE